MIFSKRLLRLFLYSVILRKNLREISLRGRSMNLPTSKMELSVTILKLATLSCKLLLQVASSLLLVVVLDLLLVKCDFLNILGGCFCRMKNYLLSNIIAKVCSGSLPASNLESCLTIINS